MKINKLYIIAALLGIVLAGCQKAEEFVPSDEQGQEFADSELWTLTIKTVATRAMELDGSTLNEYWKNGEKAAVYFGGTKIGTLEVSGAVKDGAATLSGSVTKPVGLAVSSSLTVLFPGRDDDKWSYEGQDGSAPSESGTMATLFDYSAATLTVSEINDGTHTITVSISSAFAQQQSIYRFGFIVGGAGDPIEVKSFTLSSDQNKLVRERTYGASDWESDYGSLTVTSVAAPAGNLYYASVRNENTTNEDTYSFSVIGSNDALYTGTKVIPAGKLGNGKFLGPAVTINQKVMAPAVSGVISSELQVL